MLEFCSYVYLLACTRDRLRDLELLLCFGSCTQGAAVKEEEKHFFKIPQDLWKKGVFFAWNLEWNVMS